MFGLFKKKTVFIENENKVFKHEDYTDITPIAEYFKNETGVIFDKQISILNNKVKTFCIQRKLNSFSDLLNIVKKDSKIKQELIDYLTTNETFFYREIKQIIELVTLVKNASSHVEILCAPCATGEEPYSIAIALLEAGVPPEKFNILGIDINSDALNKALEASYKERSVRNLSAQTISKYFTKINERYVLNSTVKTLVRFELANIFDESFKRMRKFDFIMSRNMLIYFDKETKLRAKEILQSMRKDDKQEVFFGHADLF